MLEICHVRPSDASTGDHTLSFILTAVLDAVTTSLNRVPKVCGEAYV